MSPPSPKGATDIALVNIGRMSTFDSLLADIPAVSVGLLGFAVLTFFMILKKVKLATLLLLSSVLFTFFATIVDLTRVSLLHYNSHVAQEVDHITNALSAAREALSSIASGLGLFFTFT